MQPRVFRPAGEVTHAAFLSQPPLFTIASSGAGARLTKSQKEGLRYEKRVQEHLRRLCKRDVSLSLLCNPWVLYHNRSNGPTASCFCQPDCLLLQGGKVTIVECKLSHTNDSWQQLRLLYEPVLRKIYPKGTEFALLEVCKWFDPHTAYTETFYYCEDILTAESGKLGIHIYKPRGRGGEVGKLAA